MPPKRPFNFEQRETSKPTNPDAWICILDLYLHLKRLVPDAKLEFLNYVHMRKCNRQICKCENYYRLISHLDSCHNALCKICPLVHLHHLRSTKRLGSIPPCLSRDLHRTDYIIEDTQPACKRRKDEDASFHVNWSRIRLLDEDNTEKMNEGSIWQNSNEDVYDNKIMGNNDPISHSEVPKMVDDQSEMGRVDTITSSPRSFNSHDISALFEESPIDEGQTTELTARAEHDSKVSFVSLIDSFTADQIGVHLCSLNPSLNSKLGGKLTAPTVGQNTCQLCTKNLLTFAAPTIFCTCCAARIIPNSTYYRSKDENPVYFFCTKCFKQSRSGMMSFNQHSVLKAELIKGKNTSEFEEGWVQCDRCDQWQHQICGLYNSQQDHNETAEYICPFCRLKEIEANIHVPIHPPSSGARHLQRTKLSNHIEQRLFRSLEQERQQRVEILGKPPEEVEGASGLSVRVVLAANKKLKVKQPFLDIFPDGTYPTEFSYKFKVILLFQKIEGADVCLFAMYVKEFGSECSNPNKRSVYISYLDSVNYFRPEIKTISGLALRTFVYHEILIGYLDYCKTHGFANCYIWACPPLKGDSFILNCHPQDQKIPTSNKLVQWYKKMIEKARAENVVVDSTNFYDQFFESNSKITAARLPYFDGDCWSAAIEDIIKTIGKDSGQKAQMTKTSCKAMGHSDLSKDALVMHELGQRIQNVKENIMVVQLQFKCTSCDETILSGGCWSCNQCIKLHLCDRCVEFEEFSIGMEMHTDIHGEKHPLYQILTDAPADVEIEDGVLENNIFDDRHSFLDFCEKNYYQFDTLRRAKHSSMMILHHLHKPT